jgi:hypothetical protein
LLLRLFQVSCFYHPPFKIVGLPFILHNRSSTAPYNNYGGLSSNTYGREYQHITLDMLIIFWLKTSDAVLEHKIYK